MILKTNKITVNIVSSGFQVIAIGLVYFFLYRYLLRVLNVETLGVWSVVLATSSLANLANFGISTSVIRYVALYSIENDTKKMKGLIFTSALFLTSLFIGVSLFLYPFAGIILKYVISDNLSAMALSLLPYSIACLIINALAGVYSSVLDGLQKNYIRSIIFTSSAAILLVMTFILTPMYGLKGVAMAQVIQSLFSLIVCIVVVIKYLRINILEWNWDNLIFKEIFSYGMKFQFISFSSMLNEPVSKVLLVKYGGLAYAGYYEMASRLTSQVRAVVVSATQSLIPILVEKAKEEYSIWFSFYKLTFQRIFAFSLYFLTLLISGSSIVSVLWIGHDEIIFNSIVSLISVSIFINLLCSAAYFSYLAEGKLNTLIFAQIIIGLSNLIIGILLGFICGGFGVVLAWVLALTFGSVYLLYNYHTRKLVSFWSLFNKKSYFLLLGCIIVLLFPIFNERFRVSILLQVVLMIIISILFLYLFVIDFLPVNLNSKKNES